MLFNPALTLACRKAFELKIPLVGGRTHGFTLQDDEDHGADTWDQVQGQIHEIFDNSTRREPLKRFLDYCHHTLDRQVIPSNLFEASLVRQNLHLPNLLMASVPDLTWRPEDTRVVMPLVRSVYGDNVSQSAAAAGV